MPNDASTTATSSPYPSRPESATYHRPDLPQVAYPQRPQQVPAGEVPKYYLFSRLTFCDFYQARGPTMVALLESLHLAGLWNIQLHSIHMSHTQPICHILLTTPQYHIRAWFIHTSHIRTSLRPRRRHHRIPHLANAPLLMNHRLLGARGSGRTRRMQSKVSQVMFDGRCTEFHSYRS